MSWKKKLIGYLSLAAIAFGSGYGVKAAIPERKPDYSDIVVEEQFYQDSEVEFVKKINKEGKLEIYIQSNETEIPLREDLILLENKPAYDALEKRLAKDPKANEGIIDEMFNDAYKLKLATKDGKTVKEGHANPSDLSFGIDEDSEGVYAYIEFKQKDEKLPVTIVKNNIYLGGFDRRLDAVKEQLMGKLSEQYDKWSDKAEKALSFLRLWEWGS